MAQGFVGQSRQRRPEEAAGALEALKAAQGGPLAGAFQPPAHQAAQAGGHQSGSEGQDGHPDEHGGNGRGRPGQGDQQTARHHTAQAHQAESPLPDPLHQGADQAALHHRGHHPHHQEGEGRQLRSPAKGLAEVEHQHRGETAEGEKEEEEGRAQPPHPRVGEHRGELAEGLQLPPPGQGDACLRRMGFRQQGEHHHQIHHRKAHRHEQRQGHGVTRQQSPQARAKDEAQAEGHADQPKGPRPLLRCGDVGQHGGGGGGGAAAQAIDQPGEEEQGQGQAGGGGAGPQPRPGQAHREGEQAQPQHRSAHTEGHHGPTAEAITEGPDQGGGAELGHGIAAGQQAEGATISAEARQQEGQQREHDALPQPIVEQGEEGAEPGGGSTERQGGLPLLGGQLPTGKGG